MKIQRKGKIIIAFMILISMIFALRLIEWQVIDYDVYSEMASNSTTYSLKLEAARGEILDTNGEPLAASVMTYNVVMNALEIDSDRNPALFNLIELMRDNEVEWENILPIEIDLIGNYQFTVETSSEKTYLLESMLGLDDTATAEECMDLLIARYNCEDYSRQDALDIISIRYGMTRVNFNISDPYVIAEDVSFDFVEIVSEQSSNMNGVEIEVSSKRDYGDGTLAPHIIGTIGLMSSSQYDSIVEDGNLYSSNNIQGYSYNDVIGQSGIESVFEDLLRGDNGSSKIYTDENGETVTEIVVEPVAGENVYLTLDTDLQEMLNYSLAKNVEAASSEECVAGAAVVLDIETFGVLASSTYPTYDLELAQSSSSYYAELLADETLPLFNRAFSGQFAPGSVMKPLVALAGLEEGVITDDYSVYCDKVYDYYASNPLTCIGTHNVGYVDLYTAMYSSCNSFFCDVGRLLGIDTLEIYANLFSLGEKTGIELYEASGTMTNPDEYEDNHGTSWVDGVTIQAAIGQADSAFTPLQLATYCATIANDGVRLETHLFNYSTSFDNSEITSTYEPQVVETIDIDIENIEIVQESMRAVVTTGTASSTFSSYGIAVAAKTGTSENADNPDTTTFIAYAPYDDPEIAIAVVIEYGENGTLSRNVAKDLFDAYFFGITVEEKIAEDLQ